MSTYSLQPITERSHGRNSSKNLRSHRRRNHGRMLLLARSLGLMLSWFSYKAKGMVQPTVGWALLHQLIIKKSPNKHAHQSR